MGEECIEFSLHTGFEAGEHGGNQGGKGQRALTGKRLGRQTNGIEQFGGMQILSEIYKDILILRISFEISMKISKLREKLYHTSCKMGRGGLKLRGLISKRQADADGPRQKWQCRFIHSKLPRPECIKARVASL